MEYRKIKEFYPEFQSALADTLAKAKSDVKDAWGLNYGGLFPGANEYGETTIRPRFVGLGTTSGKIESWNRNLATVGWQDFINNSVIEDVYLGIVGFAFPNVAQRCGGIRIEAGQRKFPVLNLEGEMDVMEEPAVIFEKGIVIPEEETLKLRVHALTKGYNVIKPLGFALAKSKVLISETPS
jgi:hypothetical protein